MMKIKRFDATLSTGGNVIFGRMGMTIVQDISPSGALINKTVYEFHPQQPGIAKPAKTGTVKCPINGTFDVYVRRKNALVYELDPIQ